MHASVLVWRVRALAGANLGDVDAQPLGRQVHIGQQARAIIGAARPSTPPADHEDMSYRCQHADPVSFRVRRPAAAKPQVNADSDKDEDWRKY